MCLNVKPVILCCLAIHSYFLLEWNFHIALLFVLSL